MTKIQDFRSRFRFQTTPFTREFPITDRFMVKPHEVELNHLCKAVEQRMSAALVAPAGHGKTTVLRALVQTLPEARYRVSYLKVTDLSKRDLCREISHALGASTAGTFPSLVRHVQQRLGQSYSQEGMRNVLIFDEAHDFRPEVLGIIRILTNFDMDSRLVVSVILAGQGGLGVMLERDVLQDVASRLGHRAKLPLLSREELMAYVHHRCVLAGCAESPFETSSLETIFELGRGNLRATDHLALKSLQLAHEDDQNHVSSKHVIHARQML